MKIITNKQWREFKSRSEVPEKILADEPRGEGKRAAAAEEKVEDLEKIAESASVIKLVNQILQQAIGDRATDIHIEHFRDELRLRYRVDGILYDTQVSENIMYLYPAIISRIKVMSGLDIVERRVPQDGRHKVKIGKSEYELRVSVIPTLYGENVAIRIPIARHTAARGEKNISAIRNGDVTRPTMVTTASVFASNTVLWEIGDVSISS